MKKITDYQPIKQLNLMMSNGLMLLTAKPKKNNSLCIIYATDFTTNFRLLFDVENKSLLKIDGIEFSKSDLEAVVKAFAKE